MYKIIGGDQKEYGPVSLEQIAGWIRDNRANAQTLVQREGGPWVPLGTVPELAALLPQTTTAASAPPAGGGFQSSPPPAAPAAFSSGIGDAGRAREMVSAPAVALLATGVICLILSLVALAANMTGANFIPPNGQFPPEMQPMIDMLQQMQGPVAIVSSLISVAISVLILFAGMKMRSLSGFALVVTAAVLAIFPCTSPCCCIGIPVGIWVLVVLFKPEVKPFFQ